MAQDLIDKIRAAAQAKNVDPDVAVKIAQAESSLNPEAGAKTSSAKGLFQIVNKTWSGAGGKPGQQKNPDENIRVGTDLIASNTDFLRKNLGRDPRASEVYAAHFFGPTGASTLLAAAPDTPAASLFSPAVLKANPQLQGKTADQIRGMLQQKMGETTTAPAPAKPTGQTPAEQMMEPALRSGMTASAEDLGSGYKAALALSFLGADDADKPESDDDLMARLDKEEEDTAAAELAAYKPKNALADLQLSATSHLKQQPVHLASGGLPFTPSVGIKGTSREQLDAIKAQYDKYNADADAYNAALNKYKTELYDPYISAVDKYNAAATEWNAGPRTTDFGMSAPTAPKAFEMTAPTAPTVSAEDYAAMQEAAKRDMTHRQAAIDAASDPERYGLTINKFFADGGDVVSSNMPLNPNPMAGTPEMMLNHGGVVHRADGSPEEGERLTPQQIEQLAAAQRPAFVTPSSGRGRQQGPISQALNSGAAYPAMARGVAELPYDIVGAPVDLATMAMRPFGYSTEKPVMGSDWIKEKMTSLGVRPGPESDPTLAGFRTAGELGANLVNPAAVARRVGPAVEQGVKAVGRAAGEAMNERMLAGQSIVPGMNVAPPIAFAVPPGPGIGAVAAVTPENQFVGRLDNFVATMKNPVRKDQLIAQVSKNFREYDVGRLETALADVASDAKLTPAQITERLGTTYNPNKFRTTVIEPSEQTRGSFYQGMDNPYYDQLSGNGPPLGVIHMSLQGTPEQQAAQQAAKDTSEAFRRLLRASANPDEIQMVRGFLQTPEFNALPNARELSNKFDTGIKQAEKINAYMKEVSELDNKLRYPILSADYQPIFNAKMEQYRGQMPWSEAYDRAQMETHHELIDKANQWLTKNGYQGLSSDTLRSIQGKKSPADDEDFITAVKDAIDPVEVMVMKAHDNLKNYLKAPVYEVNQALAKDLPYTGQHTSLKNESNPIAFSRFSAHTTQIPGIGEAKGIYVNELQSDLLDDLRKMGKKGGSKEKDIELVQKTEKEIDDLRQKMNDALATGKGAQAEDLSKQIDGAKKRLRTLESRARVGTYDVPEAIHNMENLPQVTQQLMAKNVIGAAIQRGDQFVAFPGKESAQAQLYEKLPYNLKQVVKDLGPGFEIRPIELDSPQGKMMHTAVVWGPEAAARIKKTGVPFKDGGAVERVTTDNRRYL